LPKDGYVSITIPEWQLEASSLLMAPGQTFQGFLLSFVLSANISKEKLQQIYDKWTAKYYPYGGMKPLG